jgi:hypothetical protein
MVRFKIFVRFSLRKLLQIEYMLLKIAFKVVSPPIALTYDAISKQDGLGAQLQRILAIKSLCTDLRVSYIHTEIADIAIHPLDSLDSESEVKNFSNKVNETFFIESTKHRPFDEAKTYQIRSLSNSSLALFLAKSIFFRRPIILSVVEPYGCSDLFPSMYEAIAKNLPNLKLYPGESSAIAIHYRRGSGNFDIQRGEGSSRELEIRTILKKCNQIILENGGISEVFIFTDAAPGDSIFSPPEHQRNTWVTNKNFDGENLVSKGIDVHSNFSGLQVPFTVVSGGNPLDSLIALAQFDFLILSRSSFGYVSALLGDRRQVWLPKDFWHPPLPKWFTY